MDKRTAAVVVTYNRKELLKENIERLLAQSMQKCLDVVIIDNASTDGTREYISLYIGGVYSLHSLSSVERAGTLL